MLRALRLFLVTLLETVRARRSRGPLRPTWSFGFEWIVRYLRRDWEDTAGWPLARLREDTDRRPYPSGMVKKVRVRDEALAGIPARWFVPPGATEERVVLYFHGGSYVYGSAQTTHADLLARLALESGLPVIGLDYRLAPEHPFPAALDDARAAFDALLRRGRSPSSIVLAGDSAGGNLAVELQLALRDGGDAQASGAALISPWSDLEMPGRSFVDNDPFDYGTREVLRAHARAYAGDAALDDPRLSPSRARLAGLAPVLVTVGECEIPRDDIVDLARAMKDAEVDVRLHRAPDMPHNAPVFAAYHPAGQAALAEVARFLRGAVERGAG